MLLHVKRGDESLFLHETTTDTPIKNLVEDIVTIQNLRLRITRLAQQVEDLVEYGVAKETQGYSEEEMEEIGKDAPKETVERNGVRMILNKDPTGRRIGEAPCEEIAQTIKKECASAMTLISKNNVELGCVLKQHLLVEAIDLIRASILIAYPMGLVPYDPINDVLNDTEDLSGTAASKEVLELSQTSLWWASKELQQDKKLFEFVGKNEKTKIIAKIQKKGQGAPVKEAPLSEAGQRNLMAYYHRKQEQQKALDANQDDDYMNSSWANPKSLKSAFQGIGNIRI